MYQRSGQCLELRWKDEAESVVKQLYWGRLGSLQAWPDVGAGEWNLKIRSGAGVVTQW